MLKFIKPRKNRSCILCTNIYILYALYIKNGFDKCIFVKFKFSENSNLYSSLDFWENLNFKLHRKNALKTD